MNKRTPRILTETGELERQLNSRRLRSDLRAYEAESSKRFEAILMRDKTRTRRIANSGYSKPVNIVKRTVYGVGENLFTRARQSTLKKVLEENSHPRVENTGHLSSRMLPVEDNPFFWVYQLTFFTEVDEDRQDWMLSRDEISKHSRELYFAYMNNIPPEYLIGFIMQVGARNILKYHKDKDWFSWKELPRSDLLNAPSEAFNIHSPETTS